MATVRAEAPRRALRRSLARTPALQAALTDVHAEIVRRRVTRRVTATSIEHRADDFVCVRSRHRPGPRVGIFMRGACDLPAVFTAAPLLSTHLAGTVCIFQQGIGISDSRPDILLQSLERLPRQDVVGVTKPRPATILLHRRSHGGAPNLALPREYFEPRLFEPTFTLPWARWLGTFPKTVVVLSLGAALQRVAYRHRDHGYLVDPGGWWLGSVERALLDRTTVKWFKERFESVGRMTVEEFRTSFAKVVRLVKERTGAHVLVFNGLVVEPNSPHHNYQFIRNNQVLRRRDFDLTLRELSAELDFHIVDVDRVIKEHGFAGNIDSGHFPNELLLPLGSEVFRILESLELT